MAPNVTTTGVLYEDDTEVHTNEISPRVIKPDTRKVRLVWKNIVVYTLMHLTAVYGFYLMFTSAKLVTSIFAFTLYLLGGYGITIGVHRLWSHRAFKATWPLRFILVICNTLAFQNSVIEWARDHRLHHKYSETDADPHNANRGFFFAHVGWLLSRKHPEVIAKGKLIDVSDLHADPLLAFQHKHYFLSVVTICFVLPMLIPIFFWNETLLNAFCVNIARYVFTLHATWLVNSAAHKFGQRPYDRFINPTENLAVAILALGEGWHNFHHTFPWDYNSSEMGSYSLNVSSALIDFFAKIGWVSDMKTVSPELVKTKALKTGDKTHPLWGWGDKDQLKEDYEGAKILYRKGE